ncbi:tail tube protein [Paraburkholderia sp. BL8N3]|nr:phage tail tube protein [Paraburkholderia sp. BL8N3]TCK36727.1 tail tube protein [Paraburkholderia sp. BL8N3]
MSSNLIAGTAQLTVDGVTYQLVGEAKYMPSTVKREALLGMDGFHGWKETPIAGSISMSVRDAGDLTVFDFNTMRNATVVLQLANGKVVCGRNMGSTESQEVDTEDAKFELKFEGPQVSEQTVS